MFGAYQAGAWRELSRHFLPDHDCWRIGGRVERLAYRRGPACRTACRSLARPGERVAHDARAAGAPRGKACSIRSRCASGRKCSRPITRRASISAWRCCACRYCVPFWRVARRVTWRHLLATCSVPGGYPPVRIGRAWYCDGGLIEAAPVWAAAAMGADRAIVVNAARFAPPTWLRALSMGSRLLRRQSRGGGGAWPSATWITPNDPFGLMLDGAVWRRDRIERGLNWAKPMRESPRGKG